MLITNSAKTYEKPDSGLFLGVLADIVYIKAKPTQYGPRDVARLIWILDAKDKEGNFYRVMSEANQSLNEKARLYTLAKDIRNGVAPPVPFELDELIGSVNQLVITREKSADGTKDFANIKAIIPNTTGKTFAVPAGFVRDKDKPAKGTTQGTTQATTTASASATAPAAAASVDTSKEVQF